MPYKKDEMMRTQKSIVSLVALLLCSTPLLAHAQIYKWVNAQGVTQYSGTPPTGRTYETLASPDDNGMNTPTPTTPSSTSSPTSSPKAPVKAPVQAKQIPDLKQRCEVAQKDIQTLKQPRRIRVVKADGSVQWLSDSQRAAHLKQAQAFYNRFCAGK